MRFSELKPGNIFRYAGDIYMKTVKIAINADSILSFAIRLKDGGIIQLVNDTEVTQVQQWTYNFTIK